MDDFDRDMDFGEEEQAAPVVTASGAEEAAEHAPAAHATDAAPAATTADATKGSDNEYASDHDDDDGATVVADGNPDTAAPAAAAEKGSSKRSSSASAASSASVASSAAPSARNAATSSAAAEPAPVAAEETEDKEDVAEPEMCSLCDEAPAVLRCDECDMAICAGPGGCDNELHTPKKMRGHKRTYLDGRPYEPPGAAAAPVAAVPAAPAAAATLAAPPADDGDEASYGADDFGSVSMDQSFAAPSVSVAPTAAAAAASAKPAQPVAPLQEEKEEEQSYVDQDDEYGDDNEFAQTQQVAVTAPVAAPAKKKPAATASAAAPAATASVARASPASSAAAARPAKTSASKPTKPAASTAAATSSASNQKADARRSAKKPAATGTTAVPKPSAPPAAAVNSANGNDDEDDYADDDDGTTDNGTGTPTANTIDESTHSILSPFFHALLQDPFHPSSVGSPLLEGMVLPVTLQCRAGGKVTAVFYTDALGFVRYHAFLPGRERKDEARARKMEKPIGLRAMNSRQAAPLLLPFHPHAPPVSLPPSAALSIAAPASQTTPAYFHPKCLDSAVVDPLDILRMFTPQRRERNLHFLKKQRHKAKRAAQLREAKKTQQLQQQQQRRPPQQQGEEKDNGALKADEDNYSDDGENYTDDDEQQQAQQQQTQQQQQASKSAASGNPDELLVDDDDDSPDAMHAREAFRAAAEAQAALEALEHTPSAAINKRTGAVHIEVWKREERMLMQARQRAAFLRQEAERARERLEVRQRAVEQECLYVALLIHTEGVGSDVSSSAPLPPPQAITLGQLRMLFHAAVLAPRRSIPAGWSPPKHHDFLVQKLEYAPGYDHQMYRVEFNEDLDGNATTGAAATNVKIELATNQFRPEGQGYTEPTSRAHEGFRFEGSCYTFKSPPSAVASVLVEPRPRAAYSDEHRRFKKVLFNVLRRIGEAGGQGRPSQLRMYFQQGVPAAASDASGTTSAAAAAVGGAPDAGVKALPAPDMTSSHGTILPPDARKRKWYVLFADQITLKGGRGVAAAGSPVKAGADSTAGESQRAMVAPGVAPAAAAMDPLASVPLLGPPMLNGSGGGSGSGGVLAFEQDASTGATLLPGIRSYEPLLLSHQAQDRKTCVKCHAKLGGSGKGADQGSLMMLRQVLLKWLPNALFEYPEDLFRDVLGVDENPLRANWHRATVIVCVNCRTEINALKTIPPRTQLAPWLAAVPLHGVEVAPVDLANPQVQSGTKQVGVVVPAPATLPSLLPYLSRAGALHSSGSGHAAQLVPEVAYVARKNVTMMELTGVQGPSAGLAIDPLAEVRANAARLGLGQTSKGPTPTLATASSAHALGTAHVHAPDLARSALDFSTQEGFLSAAARPILNHKGMFRMESSYIDATNLNPHQHPTHQVHLLHGRANGTSPPQQQRKMLAASKSTAVLLNHPAAALASGSGTKRMLHSGSVGTLTSKSVVAGGAGTAPALPHRPLAPTVLFSPVKNGAAGSPSTKGAARTATTTRLPALSSSSPSHAASERQGKQAKAKTKTSVTAKLASGTGKPKPTGSTAPVAVADKDDDYADDPDEYATDEFGAGDVGAGSQQQQYAAEDAQYDANAGYAWNNPGGEAGQYDAAATAAYWAAQGYDVSGYAEAAGSDAAEQPVPAAAEVPAAADPPAAVDDEENYDDDF